MIRISSDILILPLSRTLWDSAWSRGGVIYFSYGLDGGSNLWKWPLYLTDANHKPTTVRHGSFHYLSRDSHTYFQPMWPLSIRLLTQLYSYACLTRPFQADWRPYSFFISTFSMENMDHIKNNIYFTIQTHSYSSFNITKPHLYFLFHRSNLCRFLLI